MADVSASGPPSKRKLTSEERANGTKAQIMLHFPKTVEKHVEKYLYTFLDLYADVGGFATFMLGLSLLDIITFVIFMEKTYLTRLGLRVG